MAPSLFWILLFGIAAYAIVRGDRELRTVSVACVVATVLSHLIRSPMNDAYSGYRHVEIGVMAVDVALFALFLVIALRSSRFWPLWVAGLHMVTVISHSVKALRIDLMPSAYAIAAQFWGYPVLIVIAVAAFRHGRRCAHSLPPGDHAIL
ncbi:hypothetical protein [Sphingomicrobium nitratireducens]|uniref:hypothetical protein n=1 Tax=Sphingomicrobium nitratireducens TaxID=2964666 RepID=UPI00223EE16E|nr:hypothetical protein [Sphingomicrobium nitratireducens]